MSSTIKRSTLLCCLKVQTSRKSIILGEAITVNLIDSWAWPFQSDRLDLAAARQIVQTYITHRPLDAIEKRHLFDVHKLSILFDCIWYFGRGNADDIYEKRKIELLNDLGWEQYTDAHFLE